MSYIFKKGDIVRYKKDQISHMPGNLHGPANSKKEFIVKDVSLIDSSPGCSLATLEDCPIGNGSMAYRLELVKEAAEKKKTKPEGNFAWGVFFEDGELLKLTKTRQEARDYKVDRAFFHTRVSVKKIKYEIV